MKWTEEERLAVSKHFGIAAKTPTQRQTDRRNAGLEKQTVAPELGPNGVLFTPKGGAPPDGSVAYGPDRLMHRVAEAIVDGGVRTGDDQLALSLRGMGIYTEAKL